MAGFLYARIKGIPGWAALPALAAFLVDYPFYLVPAFPAVRERVGAVRLPFFVVASAVLPYLACCCGAIPFRWMALGQLMALALALGLWFFALPAHPLVDAGFLVMVAWVLLGGYFDGIYPKPYPGVDLAFLGKLAVVQIVVMTLMLGRRVPETGYGFLPTAREWRIGLLHFAYFALIGFPVALAIKAVRFDKPDPIWAIAATFLGILWVVSLWEEFLVRGVLQPWMEKWTGSRAAGLWITSAIFGLVHLWFRHQFPNWRWVLVAAILGWFCGRARNQSGGIRAGMVTHALVVTVWRAFFA
ncbi:MAG: CPBP family intramembrane metalloprotease [Acidobacteriia bacterium]|nr:CPBP family intramembrane metalloprotease [Terriglobia bacterium]